MISFKRRFKLIPAPAPDMNNSCGIDENEGIAGAMYDSPGLRIARRTEELCLSIEAPESPRLVSGERKPRIAISKRRLAPDGEWDYVSFVEINPEEVTQIVEALNKYYRCHISEYLSKGAAAACGRGTT